MTQKKSYDGEYRTQAVKLGQEIVFNKAAVELGINVDTLYRWNKQAKKANLDLGPGSHTPKTAPSLTEEVQQLTKQNKELAKENDA